MGARQWLLLCAEACTETLAGVKAKTGALKGRGEVVRGCRALVKGGGGVWQRCTES